MNAKRAANLIRKNYFVSHVAARVLRPVQGVCAELDEQIRRKVWFNGGTVTFDKIELVFPKDIGVSYSSLIYWNGFEGYEPDTWRVLRALLLGAGQFLDVGGNIGLYSVLARKLNPALRVDVFEPVPAIYAASIRFHVANGFDAQGLWQMALSDRDGEATLFLPLEDAQVEEETTGTLRADSWQSRWNHRSELVVKTVKLDTWLARDDGQPLVIKIDVEDHESAVLAGARETIMNRRPPIVCEILVRAHGNRETLRLLDEFGYRALAICREGLFVMHSEDFAKKRSFTNFLLLAREWVGERRSFFSYDELGTGLLTGPGWNRLGE